jgi:hypothetical protein
MAQFDAISPVTRNGGITNGREIGAYALAQAIKIVLSFAVSLSGLLLPVYLWASSQGGGGMVVMAVSLAVSLFWAVVLLVLFLLLRGALGGVPTMVAGPGREQSVTSSGGEIGAYVIATAILLAVMSVLSSTVLGPIYVALTRAGERGLAVGVGVLISTIGAVIVYAIFIGLRAAFCRR